MKSPKTRLINRGGNKSVQSEPTGNAAAHTRKVPRPVPASQGQPLPPSGEPPTRMFRFKHNKNDDKIVSVQPIDFAANPIVGWLVVISGPGQGKAIELGYGMNEIGRSPEVRVSLNFGDDEISRKRHAMLTYDPKGRKFYIQHGGGANLTYLDDTPLLDIRMLTGGETIELGKTVLKFVALCGADFDWQDQSKAPDKK
ncbi:FHA domain-containing protein [Desulfococcaceae bacterium HSG9]|nr:FHA domain-containing protein [Desulfococcaceae bacterium HSG9]